MEGGQPLTLSFVGCAYPTVKIKVYPAINPFPDLDQSTHDHFQSLWALFYASIENKDADSMWPLVFEAIEKGYISHLRLLGHRMLSLLSCHINTHYTDPHFVKGFFDHVTWWIRQHINHKILVNIGPFADDLPGMEEIINYLDLKSIVNLRAVHRQFRRSLACHPKENLVELDQWSSTFTAPLDEVWGHHVDVVYGHAQPNSVYYLGWNLNRLLSRDVEKYYDRHFPQ